jgi:hypothetical protein
LSKPILLSGNLVLTKKWQKQNQAVNLEAAEHARRARKSANKWKEIVHAGLLVVLFMLGFTTGGVLDLNGGKDKSCITPTPAPKPPDNNSPAPTSIALSVVLDDLLEKLYPNTLTTVSKTRILHRAKPCIGS